MSSLDVSAFHFWNAIAAISFSSFSDWLSHWTRKLENIVVKHYWITIMKPRAFFNRRIANKIQHYSELASTTTLLLAGYKFHFEKPRFTVIHFELRGHWPRVNHEQETSSEIYMAISILRPCSTVADKLQSYQIIAGPYLYVLLEIQP